MKQRQSRLVLVIAVVLAFVIGCASTPKQKSLLTIETFNGIYKQYLDEYDRQSDDVQKKWKEQIDPYWKEASQAIGAYLKITDPNSSEAQKKIALYNVARNHAVRLLLTYGIEIKEE